jgi:hypothetical protein
MQHHPHKAATACYNAATNYGNGGYTQEAISNATIAANAFLSLAIKDPTGKGDIKQDLQDANNAWQVVVSNTSSTSLISTWNDIAQKFENTAKTLQGNSNDKDADRALEFAAQAVQTTAQLYSNAGHNNEAVQAYQNAAQLFSQAGHHNQAASAYYDAGQSYDTIASSYLQKKEPNLAVNAYISEANEYLSAAQENPNLCDGNGNDMAGLAQMSFSNAAGCESTLSGKTTVWDQACQYFNSAARDLIKCSENHASDKANDWNLPDSYLNEANSMYSNLADLASGGQAGWPRHGYNSADIWYGAYRDLLSASSWFANNGYVSPDPSSPAAYANNLASQAKQNAKNWG